MSELQKFLHYFAEELGWRYAECGSNAPTDSILLAVRNAVAAAQEKAAADDRP